MGRSPAGTDCPNVATVSGYSLHRELELLTRCGLSPMAALLAATRRPAERLAKADLFGTVAPGTLRRPGSVVLDADRWPTFAGAAHHLRRRTRQVYTPAQARRRAHPGWRGRDEGSQGAVSPPCGPRPSPFPRGGRGQGADPSQG
ncbi:MAG: hypothetical protein U0531_14110 [Dehalococcoidia bacterium]